MAKFFKILAASVGSGIVLGAGIRLGEALGNGLTTEDPKRVLPPRIAERLQVDPVPAALISRLDRLEEKISQTLGQGAPSAPAPEWQSAVAAVAARIDSQQADVDSLRKQVSQATRTLGSVGDIANHLRGDLQTELSRHLDERLAAVEARVHIRMEAAQTETLDAMLNAVENRVTPRILQMESQIAGQTAAVTELRECALQSERSVQRLLGVLERMVNPMAPDCTPPVASAVRKEPEQASVGRSQVPSSLALLNLIG